MYYTIRQAYTLQGDPIGFYAARQASPDGPVLWTSYPYLGIVMSKQDAEGSYAILRVGNTSLPPKLLWQDIPEESTLPADIVAFAHTAEKEGNPPFKP